ncbi:hypothetical protein [Embleya sp. NPDC059237]|uniref:hypothetical protein n=1 Tax=Embleya sp. NPDC059237 TaxID=3346784 RepID=UPI0036CE69E5
MSKTEDLLKEIRALLATGRISYQSASDIWDVYEGFIFSLVVATASRHGATVTYENVKGVRVKDLVFRTSPGQLYSDGAAYTHAVVRFDGAPPLEVHVGVRVQGTSGVLHECDVLVLPAAEATLSRVQRIAPRGSQCVLVIECKYYTSGLGIGQARNFEGLRADIRTQDELFVSNIGAMSVVKYLDARKRQFERNVLPGTSQTGYVQAGIRNAFKSYLSKNAPSTLI